MSSGRNYPIENLLRPPVEFAPAFISGGAAVALLSFNHVFNLPWTVQAAMASGFMFHSIWRFREGNYIIRYQRNLKRLPKYMIKAAELPVSRKRLFLGIGFEWTQVHTNRLLMARNPINKDYVTMPAMYHAARKFEFMHESDGWPYSSIIKFTSSQSLLNPVKPLPPVGGDTLLHGVEPDEDVVTMDLGERNGHTLVLGTTRVGKTRLAEVLIAQDIRRGDVVIVFDPKGDSALLLRMYAEAVRAGREDNFWFFHLGYPDGSARYNPIGNFSRTTEVATRIAGQLPGEGQSAAFREFVWRFVNVIARAMTALGRKPDYKKIYENATYIEELALDYFEFWLDRDHKGWREAVMDIELDKQQVAQATKSGRGIESTRIMEYLKLNNLHDPVADGLVSVLSNDRSYFEKLVSSLYPLLEKLTTGKTAGILSPDYTDVSDKRPIFDWPSIIDKGGIVYVGLDSLSDYEVASAVGNSMFADLTSYAGRIYKHGQAFGQSSQSKLKTICLHADEFNELIGDEFIPLLNKAGGAGYQVTVYTQTWSDVEAKIGNSAKALQIGGNLNTVIMLRVKNKETAEILTNQLDEVSIITSNLVSGATDSSDDRDVLDFTTRNEDRLTTERLAMLSPADFVKLPKGQAFALIEGGHLMKVRLPLFDPAGDQDIPDNIKVIAADMARRYASYVNSVESLTVEGLGSGYPE